MSISDTSKEFYGNLKTLKESFLNKIIILFCVYLFSNYMFDRIDHEELYGAFHEKPNITIQIPKNASFKIIITIILVITSQWVYKNIIKQHVYPNN
jgi:hypothetical protein